MAQRGGFSVCTLWIALLSQSLALEVAASEPPQTAPGAVTREELEAWLAKDPAQTDVDPDRAELEEPLVEPRRRGLVIEGSAGALGHLGDMRHVSPIAPWLRLQVGYEPFDWLMVLGQGDLALANTSLARRPPDTRSYGLFGFGLGARLTWRPAEVIGLYLQGEAGIASVTADVLATYGYFDADRIRPYLGGTAGIEWLQVSPHYGLALYGGVRDYVQSFERSYGERPPLAWISGLSIRYSL